jgi:hypothetical protein
MSHFKQAPPDPYKAARDGVANYIPARSQVNVGHTCVADCTRVAKWDIYADKKQGFYCDNHRKDLATTASTYQEKRIR